MKLVLPLACFDDPQYMAIARAIYPWAEFVPNLPIAVVRPEMLAEMISDERCPR